MRDKLVLAAALLALATFPAAQQDFSKVEVKAEKVADSV
jgi:hypothetical protein